jgi:transcriptional regulator with XRE-family HTH domain
MFSDWLRAERQARGWSQSTLAERLGVRANTVNQWERQKRTPDTTTLIRLAAVLGLPIADVLAAAGLENIERIAHAPLDALTALGMTPPVLAELLSLAKYIEPEDWNTFLKRAQQRAAKDRAAQERQHPQRDPSLRQGQDVGEDDPPLPAVESRYSFTAPQAHTC